MAAFEGRLFYGSKEVLGLVWTKGRILRISVDDGNLSYFKKLRQCGEVKHLLIKSGGSFWALTDIVCTDICSKVLEIRFDSYKVGNLR